MWDGIQKRASDHGKESPDVMLARIDWNIQGLTQGASDVKQDLITHAAQDEAHFSAIRKDILILQRVVWIATGIIVGLDALPRIAELMRVIKL